ncbi:MAG: exodeoxyribonuclease VII large subunit [Brockia lithotrophica]|nr:exodeoxyribonuclease VII large subunit [Brockia lithotrophica]
MLRGKSGDATVPFLSVSALTNLIRQAIRKERLLQNVWVRGEISNFRHHSSGHMYFTLKDESSRLKCVMFSGYNQSLSFHPQDGLSVVARGDVDVYPFGGEYQLRVQEMYPDGLGEKFLEFERLKKKLQEEGLFGRKRKLPRFPERIGLVTSDKGAAVHDVLRTLARHYPRAEVVLSPALVQGEDAVPSLLRALERLRTVDPPVDILLVVRGGGDIEDLWAFNDETLARALFAFPAPVVTGIGHESDVTLADFVADLRAPTPTGAAELAVPDQEELLDHVRTLEHRLFSGWRRRFTSASERVERLARRRVLADPLGFLEMPNRRADPHLLGGLYLLPHVNSGGGIVAHEENGEMRDDSTGGKSFDIPRHLPADAFGEPFAVDAYGHVYRLPSSSGSDPESGVPSGPALGASGIRRSR